MGARSLQRIAADDLKARRACFASDLSQRVLFAQQSQLLTETLKRHPAYASRGHNRDLAITVFSDDVGMNVVCGYSVPVRQPPAKAGGIQNRARTDNSVCRKS